jgi:hypothetical protein
MNIHILSLVSSKDYFPSYLCKKESIIQSEIKIYDCIWSKHDWYKRIGFFTYGGAWGPKDLTTYSKWALFPSSAKNLCT